MKIHHLNCATFCPPSRLMINGRGRGFSNPFARGKMVCHCMLIETNDGLVLVDTGLGTHDIADPVARLGRGFLLFAHAKLDPEETALHQIRRMGFSPSDVRHILLTHLDLDHAGSLSDFPKAQVHLLAAEREAAFHPKTAREHHRYRPIQWSHGPSWNLYPLSQGEPWFGFDAVRQLRGLPPEILMVPLTGHSRGHSAIAVDTSSGWLLYAGDAYFFHGEIDSPRRHCPRGLDLFQKMVQTDGRQRNGNQDRLRNLARDQAGKVRIFCAHDPVELAQFHSF